MLEHTIGRSLLRPSRQPLAACLRCQWRTFNTTHPRLTSPNSEASKTPVKAAPPAGGTVLQERSNISTVPEAKADQPLNPLESAPRSYGKRVKEFTPNRSTPADRNAQSAKGWREHGHRLPNAETKTSRLCGLPAAPEETRGTEVKMARPYFRDWTNLEHHKGKTFLAPPRLFRHDRSLYFPNLYGQTIRKDITVPFNTTPTLKGKASVVTLFSSGWAEKQVKSFMSKEVNPALHELLKAHEGRAQLVQINVEDQTVLRYWILRAMTRWIRNTLPEKDWDKYFTVKQGISEEIRESIGLLNSKVGYVYLLDGTCRIRWAGSGMANPEEVQSLTKGMATLMSEMQKGIWKE